MLNYIWITLLFLGIGAALSTDIINKTENKYRNNDPISVVLLSDSAIHKYPGEQTSARIIVTKNNYTKFYSEQINQDLNFPCTVTYNNKNDNYTIHFFIDKNYPSKWKDIASASGDKNDSDREIAALDTGTCKRVANTFVLIIIRGKQLFLLVFGQL